MSALENIDFTPAFADGLLRAQPFSRLIGARMTAFERGLAVLEIDIRDDLRQQNGYLHGGVLAYAADNALTFAAGTVLGPAILTSAVNINYLRPARDGVLVARATVVHPGRRQTVCRCDLLVRDETGGTTLCAVAQGTAMSTQTA